MQTISLPYRADDAGSAMIAEWMRAQAVVIRTAYACAAGRTEAELRDHLKARFPVHPLGSWAIHCAAAEGMRLRGNVPDGKMVFGGRDNFERRRKGLITNDEWRLRRHSRAITIVGDRTRWGNRHFRLADDARSCTVEFLGERVTVVLPEIAGKNGKLMHAVARLAAACQISLQFSIGPTHLSVTFDPMDLRRLPPGMTLEDARRADREALGHKPRGRPRKNASTHYATHRVRHVPLEEWPVHPEWRDPTPVVATRAIGIDLNPEWVGVTAIEIGHDPRDATAVRILDHRLHRIAVPINASSETMQNVMACVARNVVSMARAWNAGTIVHEDGLGKLAWSKKSSAKTDVQTVNHWSRNALLGGLARRCRLAGLKLMPVWGGYSTTIGNVMFNLPDACASAAEIARRGIAAARGVKDRLPAVPPRVHLRRWKDGEVPEAMAKAIADATCWQSVHREVKSAQAGTAKRPGIGYRRLHPSPQAMMPGRPLQIGGMGYAVNRLGGGKGAGCWARPVLQTRTVRMVGPGRSPHERRPTLKSE